MLKLKAIWKLFSATQYRKLVFGYFISLIIVITVVLLDRIQSYRQQHEIVAKDTINMSYILEEHAKGIFQKVDLTLESINSIIKSRGHQYKWSISEYSRTLKEFSDKTPEVFSLNLIDEKGKFIGQSDFNGKLPDVNVSDRKYFQDLKNNPDAGLVVSEPLIGRLSNIFIIVLAKRIHSWDGKFHGIVVATLSLDYFQQLFSELELDPYGHVTMLSYKNRILMARHPTPVKNLGKVLSLHQDFLNELSQQKRNGWVKTVSVIDKVTKVFGYTMNREFDFIIIVGNAESDYLKNWLFQTKIIALVCIILMLITLMLLYRYLRGQEELAAQQALLIQAAKMSTLGEMAGGIAHEINNPLAIIKGQSELLRKSLAKTPIDTNKVILMIKNIEDTIMRMSKIVTGLRTFARQTDQEPMTETVLAEIINDTLSLCTERFHQNQIKLILDEIPNLKIKCRPVEISQVILNLLTNSFDAIAELNEKWISISFKQTEKTIQIIITDSGNGIPQNVAEKMMLPFFTTKAVGKGTGLGLSISQGIIESHKGKLYYNSKSKNSQFICELNLI